MKERKTLQKKFLDGDKLNLLDNLRINILRKTSDCDGMCGSYDICGYCDAYKNKQKYGTGYFNYHLHEDGSVSYYKV